MLWLGLTYKNEWKRNKEKLRGTKIDKKWREREREREKVRERMRERERERESKRERERDMKVGEDLRFWFFKNVFWEIRSGSPA